MWHNFLDLEHLIKLCFCVWCAKCAKYLAFGTFKRAATDALTMLYLSLSLFSFFLFFFFFLNLKSFSIAFLNISWVKITPDVTLSDITPLNNLLLNTNFDKSIVGLYYIHIPSMLAKFNDD